MCGHTAWIRSFPGYPATEPRPEFVHKTQQALFDFVRDAMERQEWRLARDHQDYATYKSADGLLSPLGSLIPEDFYAPWLEQLPPYSRVFWKYLLLFPPEHCSIVENMELIHELVQDSEEFRSLFIGVGLIFGLTIKVV